MRKKERIKKEVSRIAKREAKKGNILNRKKRQELTKKLQQTKRPNPVVMEMSEPGRTFAQDSKGCVRMMHQQEKLKKLPKGKIYTRP